MKLSFPKRIDKLTESWICCEFTKKRWLYVRSHCIYFE